MTTGNTVKIFTDSSNDTLKVENFASGSGFLTIKEGDSYYGFSLTKNERLPIAKEILKNTNAVLVEDLPKTEVKPNWNGTPQVHAKGTNLTGEISQAELDYFLNTGRERLAIALAIAEELPKVEAAKAEAKLKSRRDKLAFDFTNYMNTYSGAPTPVRKAIDKIIAMEDAK